MRLLLRGPRSLMSSFQRQCIGAEDLKGRSHCTDFICTLKLRYSDVTVPSGELRKSLRNGLERVSDLGADPAQEPHREKDGYRGDGDSDGNGPVREQIDGRRLSVSSRCICGDESIDCQIGCLVEPLQRLVMSLGIFNDALNVTLHPGIMLRGVCIPRRAKRIQVRALGVVTE